MKKMNYIFNLMAGAVFLLSAYACSREEIDAPAPEKPAAKTEFRLGIADTKTSLGESEEGHRKVYWSNGDKVAINGIDSDELTEVGEAISSAVFTFDEAPTAPFNVIYPADIYKDASTVTLPAYQTWKDGTFDDGMFPMAGYFATGLDATMNYLCATIKVPILLATGENPDTDNIRVVSFEGGANERISGDFTIDYEACTLTPVASPADADKKVSVALNKSLSTTDAVDVFIVVPAMNYSQGFSITIQDAQGHTMMKTGYTQSGKELEAGKLYNMPEIRFVPSGTATGIEIWDAEDLIEFATAYNNEDYSTLGSALIATVMDDITFDATSSADFNATGGIGIDDDGQGGTNYFNGLFNGGNHTISGLVATVPVFNSVGSNGTIGNLIIDSTCSFSFTHDNQDEGMFGAVAGYHKGTIDNVKVAADVSLSVKEDVTKMTSLGGLVGYANGGKIQNGCEYSGLISTPSGFTATGKLIIGGLAGRIKTSSSSITGSYFKGAISNSAQVTSTDKSNPYLIIGGVVGFVDSGTRVTSSSSTAEHADEASAYNGLGGKIVNKTTVAYHSAVGGIVGVLNGGTVSSCSNAATIACSVFKVGDDGSRYIKSGGIAGMVAADGTVTGCTNSGTVTHRSNPRIQDIGGIAGYNAGTVTACTNNAAVSQMTSGQSILAGRVVNLGGVIGQNVANNTVSDVHNTANLEISSMEDGTSSEEHLGGVIGYNTGVIVGGESKDITNSGQVYHSPYFTSQFKGYYVGGIVGLTTASVKNAKNTGLPYFRWQGTSPAASNVYIGGIAGKAQGTSSTIENCDNVVDANITNSARVYLYLPGNASHTGNYVGGIVGLTEATNPVKNCINGGEIRTAAGTSTVPVTDIKMGGIIGKMIGSGTIDNADNSGRVRINFAVVSESGQSHNGNYLGGIIGYVTNASAVTVTGCDNSGQVDITNGAGLVQDHIVSGVVGRMDAPGSITGSKNGGAIQMTITANSVGPKDLYAAGILGYSENDVTISGCSNNGDISGGNSIQVNGTAYYTGGVVAYLKGASKILNCSNTGSTVSTQAGNNDTIGKTALTGGIAGYVEGTSASPIEIGGTTGCTVNTTAALNATRGWIAGIAAYAKYAQVSKCTVENNIAGTARGAGGLVGKAEYCTINSSSFNGDIIKANQIQAANGEGGIAGYLDNSTVDGCYCYATKFYNSQKQPFGCIVGVSNSNNTIQNCHYKSSVEGPTSGTAAIAKIAGSGTYTDGGGNAADL